VVEKASSSTKVQTTMFDSPRFEAALTYAVRVHAGQVRKATQVPYITHLLAVAALVGEYGGDEDQVIAALLHDAPEDQGGRMRLEEIRQQFGETVARIVEGCTDTVEDPKPPWRPRKEAYIEHLASARPEVLRVSSADKLHNARAIVADLRRSGESAFDRFNGKKEGTLWYYREIVLAFEAGRPEELTAEPRRTAAERRPEELIAELRRTVAEMHRLAGQEAGF
jgi:(p)ppGpp synthase/HD superfamily hydrolase